MKPKAIVIAAVALCAVAALAVFVFAGKKNANVPTDENKPVAKKVTEKKPDLSAPAVPLFENGTSAWKIVIPSEASRKNEFAAEEFASAIKKISGVELPVVKTDALSAGNHIVIGSLEDSELIRKTADVLQLKKGDGVDDAISVYTIDGNLYLAGSNPRSGTYAVYHFLREYLGVRWFWPGSSGEYMPKQSQYNIPAIAYHYQSPFRYRALTPGGNHGNTMIEHAQFRMFINTGHQSKLIPQTGVIQTAGSHSVCMEYNEFEKYPERFAWIDGKRQKRGISGCWSNEDFTKAMIAKHVNWLKRSKAEQLCAFPADVPERCECPDCTKIPDKSSRWYIYYAKLIEGIRKEYPDFRAAGLAYQEFRKIPEVPVEGLEYVEYCLYNRCYVHPLDDPACSINRTAYSELQNWQKKAPMGIYGYEFDVFAFMMYVPMQNQLALSAKKFRDMKMVRLKTEYPARLQQKGKERESADYIPMRLSAYVFAMTAWNPDLDVNDIVRDYCNYVYGAGADALYEYHTTMAKYWDGMKIHYTTFGASPDPAAINMLNPSRIRAMKALLLSAEKAVAAMPDEAERTRAAAEVAIEKRLFDRWEKTYNLAQNEVFTLNLPQCPAETPFAELDKLPVTSAANNHKPTDIRMFWTKDGIRLRVVNRDAGLKTLEKGVPGRDMPAMQYANVQITIDTNDGTPIHRLWVCPAGGTRDVRGDDVNWDPEWQAEVKMNEKRDRWSVECFLPFAMFGDVSPQNGTVWKMSVTRNDGGDAVPCAFPEVTDDECNNLAIIHFSTVAKPGKTVAILSRDPAKLSVFYSNGRVGLVNTGWQAVNINGLERLKKADLSNYGLIVIETYQYDLPPDVFREKILPAVENGAVVFFWSYFWIDKLPQYFNDPTFRVVFRDQASTMRRYSWITDTSFATTPGKFRSGGTTPPCVLELPSPESWEVLAKQLNTKLVEMPCIICRPYGKGMVAVAGELYQNTIIFMNNILEYNKVIKRPPAKKKRKAGKK